MEIKEIGNRGVLFVEEGFGAYLIKGDHRLYLCDTLCGPEMMETVKEYIETQQLNDKELMIFNSHSDWDHIWGNCAFDHVTVIGHEACKKRMEERGEFDLKIQPGERQQGKVELVLPTLTFESKMCFADDEIEFIYAPGHTIDSAICLDRKESVVYVGDLLEDPIPVLLHHDLETFIHSLEFIKSLSAQTIVTAHTDVVEDQLIDTTIAYLRDVIQGNPVDLDEDYMGLHEFNTKNVLILKYENMVREKLGAGFDLPVFVQEFWSLFNVKIEDISSSFKLIIDTKYEDLEETLQGYVAKL